MRPGQANVNLSLLRHRGLEGIAMSLTDAKGLLPRPLFRLPPRVQAWLGTDHGLAQRMAGATFLIRLIAAVVAFLSQILLARWMGSSEFGIYVYVWTWLLVVGDLVHLGLPMIAQSFIPRYIQSNAIDKLRGYLSGGSWLVFAIGSAAALLGAAVVYAVDAVLDSQLMVPLYLACLAVPLFVMSAMCDGIARSYNWIGLALVPHALVRPLLLIALVGGGYLAGVPVNAVTAMLALVAAIWGSSLLQLVLLMRRLREVVTPGPKTYEVKAWFEAALPIIAVWGFYTLLTCTDVLVLEHFRPSDEVAHYYAAAKILTFVGFVYYSVAGAVAHRFSAYHAAGDAKGLAAIVASSVHWTFWPSLAATLMILALGKPLLSLFGPQFVSAYPAMFVLAVGLLARAAVGPTERLLTMVGHQRICVLAYAAAFAVNLTLCLALARPYGGIGVAIATSTAFVIESVLLALIAKRRLGLHLFIWRPRPSKPAKH
jgi:O-antigen/teichoic acid export membrane protein